MTSEFKKMYLFANWKMYLDAEESIILAQALVKGQKEASASSGVTLAVFPSALAIPQVLWALQGSGIAVGAQNVHWLSRGGYTGEVSAEMYQAIGCEYALVGHSERRHVCGETNHQVRQKIEAILAAGLTPVVCVGETMNERKSGETAAALEVQLRSAFEDLDWPEGRPLIIAYEPVWAISKGLSHNEVGIPCTVADAEAAISRIVEFVRGLISGVTPVVLYGGSVRTNTARDYLESPHINGILVGAAATSFDSWREIVAAATQ